MIVLGVSGGIAAYKTASLVSRLAQAGYGVSVVMTRAATEFVTELTFREITGQPVTTSMWDKVTHWNVEHIALARMAELTAAVMSGSQKKAKVLRRLQAYFPIFLPSCA